MFQDRTFDPSQILLARRFGLAQKLSKVQVIDDELNIIEFMHCRLFGSLAVKLFAHSCEF